MENPPRKFSTERLHLAIYLHASGQLPFLGCLPTGSGRVYFEFSDPEGIADELELAFEQGASVPANALFASQKFLRRKADEALSRQRIGSGQ
jgi:hypothetical protein